MVMHTKQQWNTCEVMQIRTRAYSLLHRLHIRWQHNTFPLLLLFFFHLYLPVRNHASLKVHVLFQSFIKICGHFSSDIFWAVLIHFQTLLNTLISYISLNNAQDADSSSNKHDSAPVIGTLQDVNNRNYIDFSTSLHVFGQIYYGNHVLDFYHGKKVDPIILPNITVPQHKKR